MTGTRPKVVVAVIDDAIPFAHRRFRFPNGKTRFDAIWQQDGLGPSPGLFNYGALLTRAALDSLFAQARTKGLGESEIYALSGVEDYTMPAHKPLGRRSAHGAHVADLACGFEPAAAPLAEVLVGVQLDQAAVQTIVPARLSVHIVNALAFVVRRTQQIEAAHSTRLPIVVNLSFGWYSGPHDGSSLLEMAIDSLVKARRNVAPMCVILPAGNSRLKRCHARSRLAPQGQAGDSETLNWRLLPDDRTSSRMELWLGTAADSVNLTVTDPGGTALGTFAPGHFGPLSLNGRTIGWIDYRTLVGNNGKRGIRLHLARTAPLQALDASASLAPAGVWKLGVANATGAAVDFDAWIDRDGGLLGWPIVGRQSHFEDVRYARFDGAGREIEIDPVPPKSYILRSGTLNGVATGASATVVAGIRASDLASSKYSSLGPVFEKNRGGKRASPTPDIAAVSDDSTVLHGVLAAGSRSGSVVALDGTSVAAPQVTRWIANQFLQNGNPACRAAVQLLATQQEYQRQQNPVPGRAPPPPVDLAGSGRVDVGLAALNWGRPVKRRP